MEGQDMSDGISKIAPVTAPYPLKPAEPAEKDRQPGQRKKPPPEREKKGTRDRSDNNAPNRSDDDDRSSGNDPDAERTPVIDEYI